MIWQKNKRLDVIYSASLHLNSLNSMMTFYLVRYGPGQVLLVTGGEGWYQEEGKPAQLLKNGDVVNIPPQVKHWHGATKDSWFVHLALTPGETEWLEPVHDEIYNSL
ncbi:cupin domain-containing protein [Paenibacillus sp. MDMC362]|uniref:cupin domain-containing protein n=1 Tax=Paenibacillus sp. MDMC362 TaxID=2977365 RepID=UPI0035943070